MRRRMKSRMGTNGADTVRTSFHGTNPGPSRRSVTSSACSHSCSFVSIRGFRAVGLRLRGRFLAERNVKGSPTFSVRAGLILEQAEQERALFGFRRGVAAVEVRVALGVGDEGAAPGQEQLAEAPDATPLPRRIAFPAPVEGGAQPHAPQRRRRVRLEQAPARALQAQGAPGQAQAAGPAHEAGAQTTRAPTVSTSATWARASTPALA